MERQKGGHPPPARIASTWLIGCIIPGVARPARLGPRQRLSRVLTPGQRRRLDTCRPIRHMGCSGQWCRRRAWRRTASTFAVNAVSIRTGVPRQGIPTAGRSRWRRSAWLLPRSQVKRGEPTRPRTPNAIAPDVSAAPGHAALARRHRFVRPRLTKPQDSGESVVDTPLLVRGHVAYQYAESSGVDCANLLDQNPGRLTQ
jgi:hypothetical protein